MGRLFEHPMTLVILLIVVLLLFGAKRLPDLASGIGQSLKIFKREVRDLTDDDDKKDATTTTSAAAPVAPVPPVASAPVTPAPPAAPAPTERDTSDPRA